MQIRYSIRIRWRTLRLVIVSSEVVRMTVLTASRLWNIRDNLHPSWHNTSRTTAACSIGGSCRTAKPLCQLLDKGLPNIVGGNMDGVSYPKDDQGSFG